MISKEQKEKQDKIVGKMFMKECQISDLYKKIEALELDIEHLKEDLTKNNIQDTLLDMQAFTQ
jgi:hypothetical protein